MLCGAAPYFAALASGLLILAAQVPATSTVFGLKKVYKKLNNSFFNFDLKIIKKKKKVKKIYYSRVDKPTKYFFNALTPKLKPEPQQLLHM